MRDMNAAEIAAAVNGELRIASGEALYNKNLINSICIDTRELAPGCLFIPIIGEKYDGHDFINQALDAGAVGCFYSCPPEKLNYFREDKFYIRVPDTKIALGQLAGAYRQKFKIPFVQITGSVGKTTTKELIASVLSAKLNILKTQKNYNNEIGAALTLLNLDSQYQAAVIETGMNHAGEILKLAEMTRPDIAVITNIGDAHMEFFGSREGILKAKSEIFEYLNPNGLAILNGDDKLLNTLNLPFRVTRCGYSANCQVKIKDFTDYGIRGISCVIQTERDEYEIRLKSPGAYLAWTAAIGVAVGEELNLNHDEIVKGAANYKPTGSRMRVWYLDDGRILLDDCYNASPQSVTAALEVLSKTECDKRIAVLGDMGELGGLAESAHYNIGALTAMLGIDDVVAIGKRAAGIAQGAVDSGGDASHFHAIQDALPDLIRRFEPGSAMLVKASHAMEFYMIVDSMKDAFGPAI